MMCSRLIANLFLGATSLLMISSFSEASLTLPHTLHALSTKRVITCDYYFYVQRLSCEHGVINVQAAMYGRRDRTTCSQGRPFYELTNTWCSQRGFLSVLKNRCNGKKDCEINQNEVRYADPCYGTYKYVDTTYACYPAKISVTCETSILNLRCGKGQVLFIYSADYGRHDHSICSSGRPFFQLSYTKCSHSSNLVAQRCNGKRSCSVMVSNSVFGDPCFGTYKYLTVAYTCYYH